MTSASDYLENKLGEHLLRTGSFTKPTAIWLARVKTKPAEVGTGGVEVTGTGYARVQCGPADASWAAPIAGSGEFVNLVDFTFGSPTSDWAVSPTPITAFGIYDAQTGGNLLIAENLLVAQEVFNGGLPPKFAAGDLKITFS